MSAKKAISELTVAILPLGQVSARQIILTADILEQEFGVKTIQLPPIEVPRKYFNAERNRYQAIRIISFLFSHLPANAQRIIGVIEANLEHSGTSPCGGYADFYNGTAVYSVPPLTKNHADPLNNEIDQDRHSYFLIVHEFGHTLGLEHCENAACAMHKSASSISLCGNCRRWANRELLVKPGSAEERFARAENLRSFKLNSRAVKTYQQALDQAPREPHYYHRLAVALAECGQVAEAKNAMVRAAAFASDYPKFHYIAALNCLEEEPAEAEKLFAQKVAAAKDKKFAHKIIGNAYREIARDLGKAMHHYREYFHLGGDDQAIVDWYNSRRRGETKS